MTSFKFDFIVDDVLEITNTTFNKNNKLKLVDIVKKVNLPNLDHNILSNIVILSAIHEIIWLTTIILFCNNIKKDVSIYLSTLKESMVNQENSYADSKLWLDIQIKDLVSYISNAKELNKTLNWWESVKTTIVKYYYMPNRIFLFNAFTFTDDLETTEIDVVISSEKIHIDHATIEHTLPQNTPDYIIDEWHTIINNYYKNAMYNTSISSNEKLQWSSLLTISHPFRIIPITEEYIRINKDGIIKLSENKDDNSTIAKKIFTLSSQVEEEGTAYKSFDKTQTNRRAISMNYLEEIHTMNKILMSSGQSIKNPYYPYLSRYLRHAYQNFKNPSRLAIRINDLPYEIDISIRDLSLKNASIELRHLTSDLSIDIVGFALVYDTISPNTKLESVNYNTFRDNLKSNKNKKSMYWLFEENIDQYLDSDRIGLTTWNNIINGLIGQLWDTYLNSTIYDTLYKLITSNCLPFYIAEKHILQIYNKCKSNIQLQFFRNILNNSLIQCKSHTVTIPTTKIPKFSEMTNLVEKKKDKNISKIIINTKKTLTSQTETRTVIKYEYTCQHWQSWLNVDLAKKQALINEDDERYFYLWKKKALNFTLRYVKVTESGLHICRSCGSVLGQKTDVVKGEFSNGEFISNSWPILDSINDINISNDTSELTTFLDKRMEDICLYLDLYNFQGSQNLLRFQKIKEILHWSTYFLSVIEQKNVIEWRTKVLNKCNIQQTQLYNFVLNDVIFKQEEKYAMSGTLLISILFIIIFPNLMIDQIRLLPEKDFISIKHFLDVHETLFDNISWYIHPNKIQTIKDNVAFAYYIYYVSGIMMITQLWNTNKIFFNFRYKKRGRKKQNKPEKTTNTWNQKLHRNIIETMIDIWNMVQLYDNWASEQLTDNQINQHKFKENLCIRSLKTYNSLQLISIDKLKPLTKVNSNENSLQSIKFKPNYVYNRPVKKDLKLIHIYKNDYPILFPDFFLNNISSSTYIEIPKGKILNFSEDITEIKNKTNTFDNFDNFDNFIQKIFPKNTNTYTFKEDHKGNSLNKPLIITDDNVKLEYDKEHGNVLTYSNKKIFIRVLYSLFTYNIICYIQKNNVQPVISNSKFKVDLGISSVLQFLGFPFNYGWWVPKKSMTMFSRLVKVARSRSYILEIIINNLIILLRSFFINKSPLPNIELEKLRIRITGKLDENTFSVLDLSSNYDWVYKYKHPQPIYEFFINSPQMKTTQSWIGNAFKIVWEKFNKLTDETVLRNILVTLLKESIPTNINQYYPEITSDLTFDIESNNTVLAWIDNDSLQNNNVNIENDNIENTDFDEKAIIDANVETEKELLQIAEENDLNDDIEN
tara:strand:+ start:4992 stop:8984 length:3993 start_codon:yes stop_codon:yes gene_type:complete